MLPNMLVIERKAHAEALTVKHVSESVIVVVNCGSVVERVQHCSEATRHTERVFWDSDWRSFTGEYNKYIHQALHNSVMSLLNKVIYWQVRYIRCVYIYIYREREREGERENTKLKPLEECKTFSVPISLSIFFTGIWCFTNQTTDW